MRVEHVLVVDTVPAGAGFDIHKIQGTNDVGKRQQLLTLWFSGNGFRTADAITVSRKVGSEQTSSFPRNCGAKSQALLAPMVLAVEQVRRGYGTLADRYIELFGSIAAVHVDDLALITRHLAIRPGAVLDVGCGPGHITAYLNSLDVDATGIDLVPEFIAHARTTYQIGRAHV